MSLRLGIPAPIARSPISGWRVFARRRSAPGARSEVFTRADRAPSGSHGYSRPEVETRDRGDGRGTAFHARARMRAKRSDAVSKSGRRPGRPNNLLKFSRAWCAGPADDVFGGVRRAYPSQLRSRWSPSLRVSASPRRVLCPSRCAPRSTRLSAAHAVRAPRGPGVSGRPRPESTRRVITRSASRHHFSTRSGMPRREERVPLAMTPRACPAARLCRCPPRCRSWASASPRPRVATRDPRTCTPPRGRRSRSRGSPPPSRIPKSRWTPGTSLCVSPPPPPTRARPCPMKPSPCGSPRARTASRACGAGRTPRGPTARPPRRWRAWSPRR